MSRQLAIASSFAVFALSALALFAPGSADVGGGYTKGAAIDLAAPSFSVLSPLDD